LIFGWMLQDLSKTRPVYVGDLPMTSNPKPRATDKVKPRRRRGQFSTWRMEMRGKWCWNRKMNKDVQTVIE